MLRAWRTVHHNQSFAVFPSDHYYSDENVIGQAVESAFELSRREPDNIVLVGAKPHDAESEYSWVEVGAPVRDTADPFHLARLPSYVGARLSLEYVCALRSKRCLGVSEGESGTT